MIADRRKFCNHMETSFKREGGNKEIKLKFCHDIEDQSKRKQNCYQAMFCIARVNTWIETEMVDFVIFVVLLKWTFGISGLCKGEKLDGTADHKFEIWETGSKN